MKRLHDAAYTRARVHPPDPEPWTWPLTAFWTQALIYLAVFGIGLLMGSGV